MKAIYFKLKESSLSSASSNRERDKGGMLWCCTVCVVNLATKAGGEGRRKKEGRLSRSEYKKWKKVGYTSNTNDWDLWRNISLIGRHKFLSKCQCLLCSLSLF